MKFSKLYPHADLIGVVSALLCLIHCVAVPVLLVLGALSEGLWAHTAVLDYLFIVLALMAVYFATRNQETTLPVRIGLWSSTALFSLAILLHDWFAFALYLSVAASIALLVFHAINYRHRHVHEKIVA